MECHLRNAMSDYRSKNVKFQGMKILEVMHHSITSSDSVERYTKFYIPTYFNQHTKIILDVLPQMLLKKSYI